MHISKKKTLSQFIFLFIPIFLFTTCQAKTEEESMADVVEKGLERATIQSIKMAESLESDSTLLPRSFQGDTLTTSTSRWWCSGFFPGVLWYLYENNPSDELRKHAVNYTEKVRREQYTTNNHDVGFMIFCSFGNGLRILGTEEYKNVIIQASQSLSTRYRESTQLIRSWDHGNWQYPVIIDNMMNLEMLLWATKETGDRSFEAIAINHADRTMEEHFREDYSSYHLVDYDTIRGDAIKKQTVQGFNDSSSWARGQAWALYGYTMMHRITGDTAYLEQAENIAGFILNHPRLPEDKIPYWDFDVPEIPNVLRDASAASIMASAFIELSELTQDKALASQCLSCAEIQLRTLSSPGYLAEPGTNGNFILKHSIGNFKRNMEVDVPLTYADYYYIEALMRYKNLINK